MPAKRLRLPKEAFHDGRGLTKRSSRFFIVRFKANQLSYSRFAAVISLKVDRTSAGRHKLKRRVMEYMRVRPGSWDMLIAALPAAKELPRKIFLQELEKLLP